jgi:hypothetical protein
MSHETHLHVPGLTPEIAERIAHRADFAGAPIRCEPARDASRRHEARTAAIALVELSEDPSLASETIDHEHHWPQDPAVQEWLVRAARFLAEQAPERRFVFFSGWIEHHPTTTVAMSIDAFVTRIRAGSLRSDESYDVSA